MLCSHVFAVAEHDVYKWPKFHVEPGPKPHQSQFHSRKLSPCLSNIHVDKCTHGFTTAFNVTTNLEAFSRNVTDFDILPNIYDDDEKTRKLLSSLNLRMTRVNQAEQSGSFSVAISKRHQQWQMSFLAVLGYPMLIEVMWREDFGLDVYVDGICVGFTKKPFPRTDVFEADENVKSLAAESFWFTDSLRPTDNKLFDEEIEGNGDIP